MNKNEKTNVSSKKDIRIQLFITEKMDDRIADISELMGISKQDFCRTAIAHYLMSINTSINLTSGVLETNPEMKKTLDRIRGLEV